MASKRGPEDIMTSQKLISAHPIAAEVRQRIEQELDRIEVEHQVQILYACESGSRAWGFASTDSDYDVRFVYLRRPERYLTVRPERDVIECPIDALLDISGWDLRKALDLGGDSNPTLLEWLSSPVVYRQQGERAAQLRALAQDCFARDRAYHHYLSMARKNDREHLQGETVRLKKYLYVLRPLLAARWIRLRNDVPPMVFAELAEAVLHEAEVIEAINRLLAVKMRAGEAEHGPAYAELRQFIDRETEAAMASAPAKTQRQPAAALDDFLAECVLTQVPLQPRTPLNFHD